MKNKNTEKSPVVVRSQSYQGIRVPSSPAAGDFIYGNLSLDQRDAVLGYKDYTQRSASWGNQFTKHINKKEDHDEV